MNILDENIPKDQRLLLERWRLRVRQIGVNVGRRGMQDSAFDTQAKRMGAVIRASSAGISFWRLHAKKEQQLNWK